MKRLALMCCLALASVPALALYKVVGPDGKVTYTDRPPVDTTARVSTLGRDGVLAASVDPGADAGLPAELRQAVGKFPVTLYTAPDCAPCDNARQLLQQRGVPYTEKRVLSEDDAVAFERLVGARTIPGATIGSQPLRGLAPSEWQAYLDAAGYPRESRLPRGWQPAPAQPVVARAVLPEPVAVRPATQAPAPAPVPQPGIKF